MSIALVGLPYITLVLPVMLDMSRLSRHNHLGLCKNLVQAIEVTSLTGLVLRSGVFI